MGKIHAGNPATCPRLRKVLELLTERGPAGATTWELHALDENLAAGTTVSELRANGHDISCKYLETNERGRKVYRYTLTDAPAPARTPPAPLTLPTGELAMNF